MEQIVKHKDFDVCSTSLSSVEFSDNNERAILTIPLMHFGPNKKGLFWTEKVLSDVAPLFRGVPFRYDLDGREGSSHTVNKLSSPFFDVGWTYDNEDGAWYDPKTKTLWVKGEVTHPQVIDKLRRSTSDGKREVNYASMGIIVDEAKCSVCGNEYGECEHERLQEYEGRICYKVPTKCSKGLHAALTNDAADGEAVIQDCIFQEMGGQMDDKSKKFYSEGSAPSKEPIKSSVDNTQASPNDAQQPSNYNTDFKLQNQIPGGLAPSSPQTGQPGMAPSPQEILKSLAERIKTIENQLGEQTPEIVNASPQDQYTQDNMGMTKQFREENKMADIKEGQNTQEKVQENPPKPEMQEGGDMMQQMLMLLQQIAAKLGAGTEVQDASDLENAGKEKIVHKEDEPTEHKKPGEMVANSESESNKKNKENMNKPDMVATADNAEEEDNSEVEEMKKEMADMREQMKKLRGKLELQDNDVPEFGGSSSSSKQVEAADMSASERAEKFGDFGKWDACFKGSESALRFVR